VDPDARRGIVDIQKLARMLLALAQHLDRAEQVFQHHLRCLGSRQPRQYAGIGKGLYKVVNIVRARDAKAGKDIDLSPSVIFCSALRL